MRDHPSVLLENVVDRLVVSGGSISRAERVTVRDGGGRQRDLFVKTNRPDFVDNFLSESDGLSRLADVVELIDDLIVPRPIFAGMYEGRAMLILPWINAMASVEDIRLAHALASLHHLTRGTEIGLDRDNFLGASKQPNQTRIDWPTFFVDQRLRFQLDWALRQGLASDSLQQDVESITERIGDHWPDSATCLLHGDLWSGNILQNSDGKIFFIDPAVSYGPAEMELGMLRLFGGIGDRFWRAYLERNPLASGWSHRVDLAMLYHLLNHLNLFGDGYLDECEMLARRLSQTKPDSSD